MTTVDVNRCHKPSRKRAAKYVRKLVRDERAEDAARAKRERRRVRNASFAPGTFS